MQDWFLWFLLGCMCGYVRYVRYDMLACGCVGAAVGQEVPAGCSCSNNAPDDEFTCGQQVLGGLGCWDWDDGAWGVGNVLHEVRGCM